MTNRKLHTRFRLAPNRWPWMTLNSIGLSSNFLAMMCYFAFLRGLYTKAAALLPFR